MIVKADRYTDTLCLDGIDGDSDISGACIGTHGHVREFHEGGRIGRRRNVIGHILRVRRQLGMQAQTEKKINNGE